VVCSGEAVGFFVHRHPTVTCPVDKGNRATPRVELLGQHPLVPFRNRFRPQPSLICTRAYVGQVVGSHDTALGVPSAITLAYIPEDLNRALDLPALS